MAPLPLLLAADEFRLIIFIGFLVVSGIVKFLKSRSEDAAKRRLQEQFETDNSEVTDFINEVTAATRNQNQPMELSADDVIESRPRRPKRQAPTTSEPAEPPRRAVSERHLKNSQVGQVANRHVASQVRDQHLHSQVENAHLHPEADLGVGGLSTLSRSSDEAVHPIAAMLNSSDGIRNAILLNEVLAPPLSRRKSS